MGLWQVLRAGGSAADVANVEKLVEYAAGKLILVRETFPDYTMHDRQHAENVIRLVEELLGPELDRLRPIEAAMLILAAYFHDIGMVYEPQELADLADDEDFRQFLDHNPAAYVRVRQATELPLDVVVDYCRARHAERVSEHLFQLEHDTLAWDGVGIADGLATLCQSHNEPIEQLRSERFSTSFLAACDLRMCAILLRLADILDLDQSRSPAAVYTHLRLAEAAGGARAVSNDEWSKHLASRGFRFPISRAPNYPLPFLASPRRPAVEHAIRTFLDVVEEELRGSRILLDFCDKRWRSLALPGAIDRSGIVSSGYRYGEYRFSLDRHNVLRLFMGEQLYSDPYAFVRELLQNAVDACRLSLYLHDADPDSMQVRVSAWEDADGSYWFRVDDTGSGMDQGIVQRYFLGVGRSYYRSEELKADILRKNKPRQNFEAISRFGIGVLSSFIVGDRIEVSTRRRMPDGTLAVPLRLSLDGLDDFFVMQEQPMLPAPFPSRAGREAGYRKSPGTSVAVRIDPTRSEVTLEQLIERAREAFFFPPVRVFINDVEQHGCQHRILDTPIIDRAVRSRVTGGPDRPAGLDILATGTYTVTYLPLDLTAHSPSPAVRGQLVAIGVEAEGGPSLMPALPEEFTRDMPESLVRQLDTCIDWRGLSLDGDGRTVSIQLRCQRDAIFGLRNWLGSGERQHLDPGPHLGRLFRVIDSRMDRPPIQAKFPTDLAGVIGDGTALTRGHTWLGHNGIGVTTRLESPENPFQQTVRLYEHSSSDFLILGSVGLFDELRPDVSVSRDLLRGFAFPIWSALHLAVRRAAAPYLSTPHRALADRIMQTSLLPGLATPQPTAEEMTNDPLWTEWCNELLLDSSRSGRSSATELRELAAETPLDVLIPRFGPKYRAGRDFYPALMQPALVALTLDVGMGDPQNDDYSRTWHLTVGSARPPARPPGLAVLPPFAVLPYAAPDVLADDGWPANLRHPIVAWFAENAALLKAEHPAIFTRFLRALTGENIRDGRYDGSRAELLNAALDRIRRSMSDLPAALYAEVYADPEGRLWSRP